jgi:hypothetical protein
MIATVSQASVTEGIAQNLTFNGVFSPGCYFLFLEPNGIL